MPEPNFTDLMGIGSQWNASANRLEVPFSALAPTGLSSNPPSALEVYGAIIKNAHAWLSNNRDESVGAASELSVTAPYPRNGQQKTQFQFSERFYASYDAPEFNPDSL